MAGPLNQCTHAFLLKLKLSKAFNAFLQPSRAYHVYIYIYIHIWHCAQLTHQHCDQPWRPCWRDQTKLSQWRTVKIHINYHWKFNHQTQYSKKQLAECIALIYKHAIVFLYISWALRSELHQSHFGTHVINVQVTAPGHSRMLASS